MTAKDVNALLPALRDLGFDVTGSMPSAHLIEGFLPVNRLEALTGLGDQGLLGVSAMYQPAVAISNVTSQADAGHEADRTRATVNPPLQLNGGTIKDSAGNPALLILPYPGEAGSLSYNKNNVIDTVHSTVTSVTSTLPDGAYGAGQTITIALTFSTPVTVVGTLTFTLDSGGTATYTSGSGSSTLLFTHTIEAGQDSADLDSPPSVVDGLGVKIEVISDSFNRLGGAADDIAYGDLPAAGVQVLHDDTPSGRLNGVPIDEGRGMIELIHDLSPGSPLAFATGNSGEISYAQNIRELADPALGNCQINVDDVIPYADPFFQDGLVAQAVHDVVTNQGVAYLAAANNIQDRAYDSASTALNAQSMPLAYGSNPLNFVAEGDAGAHLPSISRLYSGFGLGWMPAETDDSRIQTLGNNQIIIADVNGVLHFRIFDEAGKRVVDTDETKVMGPAAALATLKSQLSNVTFTGQLTQDGANQMIGEVLSIVGYIRYYDFDPASGVDVCQHISLADGEEIALDLQWDQPFYTANGVTNDLDFFLLDSAGNVVAGSGDNNLLNQTPIEMLTFTNHTNVTHTTDFDLVIVELSTSGMGVVGRLKYANFGAMSSAIIEPKTWEWATVSSTLSPHSTSLDAMSVGAVPYYFNVPEEFTSHEPATILFDPSSNRLAVPEVRAKPDIVAFDGTDMIDFPPPAFQPLEKSDPNDDGFPNFYGTSAAAPVAAAMGALVKQAHPGFTPA